jgi:hypothetical protein
MKITNLDNIRDIAIKCVDKIVKEGIIKDCIDTDDTKEFDIQDIIADTLLDVKKHNEPKDSSNTKRFALADIEGLDMIKDSLCVECDSYIDYSELKDGMCSKCGETLEECSMNFDTFNEESFEEEFINLFNKYYYVKSDKPFFDYEEGDENAEMR